jgi:hypothetical protein
VVVIVNNGHLIARKIKLRHFTYSLSVSALLSRIARACLEVTKQSTERLLVIIVIFPASKVSNVALMTYLSCPGEGALKNRLIYADREENNPLLFAFLRQSRFRASPCESDRL